MGGDYYWSTSLGQVHLAGVTIETGNCSAIIDTGTSLLVGPSAVVDKIYELADAWQAAGGSCDDLSQLPDLRFTLDGKDFSLPPEAYMGEMTGDPNEDLAKYMPRFYDKQKE